MTTRRPGPPPPYADGLERAFADARRRRWRTLAVALSSPAVLLAVALTATGPALDRLTVDSVEPTSPRPSRQQPTPASPTREATPATSMPKPEPAAQLGRTRTSTATTGAVRSPSEGTQPRGLSAPMRRELVESPPGLCEPTAGTASWCADAFADHVRGALELSVLLCPHAAHGVPLLTFRDDLEVEMTVRPAGQVAAWSWSHGRSFPKRRHYVDLPPSHCVLWRTAWDGRGNDGAVLEPGRYRLGVSIRAVETGHLRIDEVEFAVR